MRPTGCHKCRTYFESQPLLQAEIRHLALKLSPGVARAELDERLASHHDEHAHEAARGRVT